MQNIELPTNRVKTNPWEFSNNKMTSWMDHDYWLFICNVFFIIWKYNFFKGKWTPAFSYFQSVGECKRDQNEITFALSLKFVVHFSYFFICRIKNLEPATYTLSLDSQLKLSLHIFLNLKLVSLLQLSSRIFLLEGVGSN
jgi:hypothetical protein